MKRTLKTERLNLRPLAVADAAGMARLVGEWDVVRWLIKPPYPYVLSDAEWFIQADISRGCFGIEIDGGFAGVVGISDTVDLVYWLGQPFQGNGYITEAASAVVAHQFATHDDDLTSGYVLGNQASGRVLEKLGFRDTQIITSRSTPMNKNVQVQRMVLTRQDWLVQHG